MTSVHARYPFAFATAAFAARRPWCAALALLLWGCASSSIRSDLASVRELSGETALPEIDAPSGEPETDEQARALLAGPLDADGAVRLALLHNRELRAQLHELGVARGQLVQASLVANPEIEAEAFPAAPATSELRVEHEISSLVLAPLRADAAEAELAAARQRAAAAVVRLGYEVRSAFVAVQASERRQAIATQSLEAFALSREAARELLEAGNVRALEAASQIAAHERARVRLSEIDLELVERRERLQRLLGIDAAVGSVRVQPGPAPAPAALEPSPDVIARALERSLELAEARSRMLAAERGADAARIAGWLPDVSVGAITAYQDSDDPWNLGGVISFGVPLFDRNQGQTRAQEARRAQAQDTHAAIALAIRSRARETERRVASAYERARDFERAIVPAYQQLLEETLLQYNAMQASVFDLLSARREQLDAELAYVETLREFWTATAALDALLAGVRVVAGPASVTQPAEAGQQEGH